MTGDHPEPPPQRHPGASVWASGLTLDGARGTVYRDIDLDAPPGSLIALTGPSGSGRTCLLLTLTGRMRPSGGRASVHGLPLPRRMAAVRGLAALGPVDGVNELEPALTVAEQFHELALLERRLGLASFAPPLPGSRARARRQRRRDRAVAALEAAGLDLSTLPKGSRTRVRDLDRLEALRLGVALALLSGPRLLAVDDLDLKLSDAERADAWALLRSISERGATVVATCSEAPEGALVVRTGPGSDRKEAADDAFTTAGRA
ncbi:ATP-binding cassette domain-containing protein [Streptomyces sp. NPDC005438]|uniref:ATP-binding cassette domain-containing protein n=1 Tax=Streptomyces sp. NPDC005438 TaxID=3156880 RepID=UPI0033ABFE7D